MTSSPLSPESVVQRQLDAYNAHDLEALMAAYAEDVEWYEHPAMLIARGATEVRARLATRLAEPNLQAELVKRMVMGNFVVDQEVVTRTFPEGTGRVELIAMYEVHEGRIARAWFRSGAKVMDKAG